METQILTWPQDNETISDPAKGRGEGLNYSDADLFAKV